MGHFIEDGSTFWENSTHHTSLPFVITKQFLLLYTCVLYIKYMQETTDAFQHFLPHPLP